MNLCFRGIYFTCFYDCSTGSCSNSVVCIYFVLHFIVNRHKELTDARPKITRRAYTSVIDVRAQTGIKMVLIPEIAIAIPKTRHPPNLSASHPPGICAKIYPQKNDARMYDCVLLSHSNSPPYKYTTIIYIICTCIAVQYYYSMGFVTRVTRQVLLVEQQLLTLLENLRSPHLCYRNFYAHCFADSCLYFFTFSFGHCVVCSSSIYGF